ncbi:DUF3784 domain-containing protein [uncultured Prevotella sp.]|uniref:DUF3784 domain-containing protein n=1 Tax=uncultured Prevotella sp. TaxID=159272 RepID=UPI002589D7EB|nr:DUF3784 domain-containing protein [uncultured Prevotella sp.]
MIVQSIIAAILVVIGVIILAGKGDMLIAGYNTASEEEKEKVNIKRLRLLIGGLSVIIASLCFIPNDENDVSLVVVLTIIVLVLANTWAKKK